MFLHGLPQIVTETVKNVSLLAENGEISGFLPATNEQTKKVRPDRR